MAIKNPVWNARAKRVFLEEYEKTFLFHRSCEAAGVCHMTVRRALKKDPEFAEQTKLAGERHKENIEENVRMRATGYEEALVYQGQLTGEVKTVFQPLLLLRYAERHIPEYRPPQKVEATNRNENLNVDATKPVDLNSLSKEQRDLVRRLLTGTPAEKDPPE